MNHNIVNDIHVRVNGNEYQEFKSVNIEKEEDGVTKMSWLAHINIRELEKRSKVPGQIILVKKTLR